MPDEAAIIPELSASSVREQAWTSRVSPTDLRRLARLVITTAAGRPSIEIASPFTGEVIGEVAHCTAEDVTLAMTRAREAQRAWVRTSFAHRKRLFLRFHDLVYERQDFLVDLLQLEAGKSRRDAFDEVADVLNVTRYYTRNLRRHLRPRRRAGTVPVLTRTREYRHPVGVVGIIGPWNYPLTIPISDAVPALLAGNAVILKPSELAPFISLAALELLREVGLPEDLLQIANAPGPEVGSAVIDRVDYVAFTGSTDTGRIVAARAGKRLIGTELELGGKNSMIVLEDAPLDRTVRGAVRNCFASAGQLCMSAERIYVHERLYDRFVERFVEEVRKLRIGAGFDYSIDIGCLMNAAQVEKAEWHIADAVEKGATVLAGGRRRPDLGPHFFEPTVLTDVTEGMAVDCEETFGPVVSIHRFDDPEDAVARANNTQYGLNASIWTRRPREGRRLAQLIEAGTVSINDAFTATWGSVDAPLGGYKASGVGRRHGAIGIQRFTESQTIAVQYLMPIAAPPGVSEEQFAKLLGMYMKLRRRLPGRK
jgi:succinate-semialdehyde dehydrogenase / glutarate-semialdehyde dehydrogenase